MEPDRLRSIESFFQGIDRVCADRFEDIAPPWRTDQLWQTANNSLRYLIYHHFCQPGEVHQIAEEVKNLAASIDLALERLSKKTCAQCLSPCCLVADVSYDFRDLLFIHLTKQALPPGQPRKKTGDVCQYLGIDGCRIPRLQRPWICTWYICASQKEYLNGAQNMSLDSIVSVIEDVGVLRKQMEDLFIGALISV